METSPLYETPVFLRQIAHSVESGHLGEFTEISETFQSNLLYSVLHGRCLLQQLESQ